jgi:hypothetical protein
MGNINKMVIEKFNMYLDGGTVEVTTDKGVFCFDNRLRSNTNGRLFDGYPKKDNSNLIENYESLEVEIIENLKTFKDEFYQESIEAFILDKTN